MKERGGGGDYGTLLIQTLNKVQLYTYCRLILVCVRPRVLKRTYNESLMLLLQLNHRNSVRCVDEHCAVLLTTRGTLKRIVQQIWIQHTILHRKNMRIVNLSEI